MAPGGQSVQIGSGVVVVGVVVDEGRVIPMIVVQSTVRCVVVGVDMTSTMVVVGQAKLMVVMPGHGNVTAVAGVWKE
jgi:hypothetical protein